MGYQHEIQQRAAGEAAKARLEIALKITVTELSKNTENRKDIDGGRMIAIRTVFIACIALAPLCAQELKLPASLDRLAAKASEVVDVTLDANLLQLASRFLSDKNPDDAQVKKLIAGLKGIYVRSFEFEKAGEYQESDIEPLRRSFAHPPGRESSACAARNPAKTPKCT